MQLYSQLLLQGLASILLRLPTVSAQDHVFISWAHSYVDFHTKSNCWVCGAMPTSVMDGLPWWVSPLQRGYMPSLYDFLHQAKQQKSSMETVITTHWLCGTNLWPWLPPGWIGMCTLGLAFAHGNIRSTIQEPLNYVE